MQPKTKSPYFDLQAGFGNTKHMGGMKATKELLASCYLEKGSRVLEIGCGVGFTSCHIAKTYGCRVVGIDNREEMVAWSRDRAKRNGLSNKTEFIVADAGKLPFKANSFDAVISESVLAFVKHKGKAVKECVRVAKPGGYVALNECYWVKAPPPELMKYLSHLYGPGWEYLVPSKWLKLFKGAGLKQVKAKTFKVSTTSQMISEIQRLDARESLKMLSGFFSRIASPLGRRYMKEAMSAPRSIYKIFEYTGYGIYVGRK